MEDVTEEKARILSVFSPKEPNMNGISADAMKAKKGEIIMHHSS